MPGLTMLRGTGIIDCSFTPPGSIPKAQSLLIKSRGDESHGPFCGGHLTLIHIRKVGQFKAVAQLRV